MAPSKVFDSLCPSKPDVTDSATDSTEGKDESEDLRTRIAALEEALSERDSRLRTTQAQLSAILDYSSAGIFILLAGMAATPSPIKPIRSSWDGMNQKSSDTALIISCQIISCPS